MVILTHIHTLLEGMTVDAVSSFIADFNLNTKQKVHLRSALQLNGLESHICVGRRYWSWSRTLGVRQRDYTGVTFAYHPSRCC